MKGWELLKGLEEGRTYRNDRLDYLIEAGHLKVRYAGAVFAVVQEVDEFITMAENPLAGSGWVPCPGGS